MESSVGNKTEKDIVVVFDEILRVPLYEANKKFVSRAEIREIEYKVELLVTEERRSAFVCSISICSICRPRR